MDVLVEGYRQDPRSLADSIQDIVVPEPLAAAFEKPDKATIVEEYVSRFNRQ